MTILVLGSGVVGVSTAYYLARAGQKVIVVDRQPGPALETSFANAGEVSPGYSAPWAAPGIPLKAIKWMLSAHSPLVIRPKLSLTQWRWMAQMLANCTHARYEVNKGRMVRVAEYSRDALKALRNDTGISYDERSLGTLQVFRKQKQLDDIGTDTRILDQFQVPYELLDVEGCVAAEPGLARVRGKLVGGLRLPGDETGDCFKFTNALMEQARGLDVEFRYGVEIDRLLQEKRQVTGLRTRQGEEIRGDGVVVALGSYSPSLLKPLGLHLPVYPVKGYSITLPIEDESGAPVSTVMDETYKVAITRLGDRIRAAGTAELAGFDLTLRPARRQMIEHVVRDLFPAGGDLGKTEFWCGLRPMTPDGTPLIGPSGVPGLYLNTGHGTLGWTMACGSGKLLADIVTGRQPDIATEGLTLDRYAH